MKRAERVGQREYRPSELRHLPGVDGLRALAVVAVIAYHMNTQVLPGGYLGVDVFFVISGYLITALLLAEIGRSGGVLLRAFWARRARRLLPALITVLVAVTLLAAIFARDALGRMRADVPSSLFYVFNWRLVAQHDSYLAAFGRPPLLLHLWSLSVEEQFYLLWPLALLVLRRRFSQGRVAAIALGGAAVSALLMAVLYRSGDPSAVYFGTETHAQGLLIGAALAAAVPPWRMSAEVPAGAPRLLDGAGLVALAVVLAGMATLAFGSSLTYHGGMLLIDLATAALIAVVAHPASRLGPAFAHQPLRWLGQRSYSLYLWHWPIFEMTRSPTDVGFGPVPAAFLRIMLTAAAAELSYRLIEQPWRTGRAQAALRTAWASGRRHRLGPAAATPLAAALVVLFTAPPSAAPAILSEGSTTAARTSPAATTRPSRREDPPRVGPILAPLRTTSASAGLASPTPASAPSTTKPTPSPLPILAIGDSVLLAASPSLQTGFGSQITIDAAVGRQVQAGLARLAEYRTSGALSQYRTVLIDLGTNGAFEPAEFDQLVQLVANVPEVIVFNVHADRPWAAVSNTTITAGAADHPAQIRLADWNRVASSPGVLFSDGIHPNASGAQLYSKLLALALEGPPGP